MFTLLCGLTLALIGSFAFILWQAVMLKNLSEELEKNLPPF